MYHIIGENQEKNLALYSVNASTCVCKIKTEKITPDKIEIWLERMLFQQKSYDERNKRKMLVVSGEIGKCTEKEMFDP